LGAVGWNARTAADAEFAAGDNVGVQSGPISGTGADGCCLVSVDLDSADAVRLAPGHLPPTAMRDGRPGKPDSHWHYRVPLASVPPDRQAAKGKAFDANIAAGRHPGPRTVQFRHPEAGMILEVRGTGGQTVCPPSVWASPDGTRTERREWAGGCRGEPATVDFPKLLAAAEALARACGWVPKADRPKPERTPKPTPHHRTAGGPAAPPPAPAADPALERRVGAWLAAIPDADLSRVGRDGDGTLLAHLNAVRWGFDLTDWPAFAELFDQNYNARMRALFAAGDATAVPWDEGELRHKWDEADPATRPAGPGRPPAATC
jgi:hypothetical protein